MVLIAKQNTHYFTWQVDKVDICFTGTTVAKGRGQFAHIQLPINRRLTPLTTDWMLTALLMNTFVLFYSEQKDVPPYLGT